MMDRVNSEPCTERGRKSIGGVGPNIPRLSLIDIVRAVADLDGDRHVLCQSVSPTESGASCIQIPDRGLAAAQVQDSIDESRTGQRLAFGVVSPEGEMFAETRGADGARDHFRAKNAVLLGAKIALPEQRRPAAAAKPAEASAKAGKPEAAAIKR